MSFLARYLATTTVQGIFDRPCMVRPKGTGPDAVGTMPGTCIPVPAIVTGVPTHTARNVPPTEVHELVHYPRGGKGPAERPPQWVKTFSPAVLPEGTRIIPPVADDGVDVGFVVGDVVRGRTTIVWVDEGVSLEDVRTHMLDHGVTCVLVYAEGTTATGPCTADPHPGGVNRDHDTPVEVIGETWSPVDTTSGRTPIGMIQVWALADAIGRGVPLSSVHAREAVSDIDYVDIHTPLSDLLGMVRRHVVVRGSHRVVSQGDIVAFMQRVLTGTREDIARITPMPVPIIPPETPLLRTISGMLCHRQYVVLVGAAGHPGTITGVLTATDLRRCSVECLGMTVGQFTGDGSMPIYDIPEGACTYDVLRALYSTGTHQVVVTGPGGHPLCSHPVPWSTDPPRPGGYIYSADQVLIAYAAWATAPVPAADPGGALGRV